MGTNQSFKYYAFISYNQKDTKWGKQIHRKLENYRLPSALCREHGWKRTPLRPVFFAPTDIQGGCLNNELQERLRASKNLIIVCSPNSAKSKWVGEEIKYFASLNRTDNIHFFIVDGTPHSGDLETECFNPVIDELGLPEILGLNINERVFRWSWLNKERAYIQLISKLLGLDFDEIWQRHKRNLIKRLATWCTLAVIMIGTMLGVYYSNQPFTSKFTLHDVTQNKKLPALENANISLKLENETKTDTIKNISASAVFTNIPHRFLNKQVNVKFQCNDYIMLDTIVKLKKEVILNINRDQSVYGAIKFTLWDGIHNITNVKVKVLGYTTTSDTDGAVSLSIPLKEQQLSYKIELPFSTENDTIYMPCSGYEVIVRK